MYDRDYNKLPTRRTPDPKPIGEALKAFLDAQKWNTKYESNRLKVDWAIIVGDFVAQQTEKVEIRNKKIFIRVSQPTLRYELLMQKTSLIYRVNSHFGKRIIEDVVLL